MRLLLSRGLFTRLVVVLSLSLLIGLFLQVIGNGAASCDEQIEQGFLDGVKTRAAGEKDLVG